jgi:hypothetical protein
MRRLESTNITLIMTLVVLQEMHRVRYTVAVRGVALPKVCISFLCEDRKETNKTTEPTRRVQQVGMRGVQLHWWEVRRRV